MTIHCNYWADLAYLYAATHNLDVHRQDFMLAHKEKKQEWKKFPAEIVTTAPWSKFYGPGGRSWHLFKFNLCFSKP